MYEKRENESVIALKVIKNSEKYSEEGVMELVYVQTNERSIRVRSYQH